MNLCRLSTIGILVLLCLPSTSVAQRSRRSDRTARRTATTDAAKPTKEEATRPPQSESSFRLKQGDRVAFFGDSITAQDLYTTMVGTHYLTVHPEMNLTFKNAGVGGDTLAKGMARIDRDLVPFKPTVITCFFGMNDGGYVASTTITLAQERFETYKAGYPKMLGILREKFPEARIVLFTVTPVDEKVRLAGYNEQLARFSEFVRELGKTEKLPVVELFEPMLKSVKQTQSAENPFSIIPDAVHPKAGGQFLMAELILRAWGEWK